MNYSVDFHASVCLAPCNTVASLLQYLLTSLSAKHVTCRYLCIIYSKHGFPYLYVCIIINEPLQKLRTGLGPCKIGRFVSELVGNPEDRFSRAAAHFMPVSRLYIEFP